MKIVWMSTHKQFNIKTSEAQTFIKKLTAKLNAKQTCNYKRQQLRIQFLCIADC